MQKSKLNWMLAALMVLVITPMVVKTMTKTEPRVDPTNYYWYDTDLQYLRQNTIANEMNLTGFDENVGTIQELGYAPSGVYQTPFPPTPMNPNSPNKHLYSHP